ncbi:MAG: AI-2E family transporter [Rhizobiaceae bacterium]|nr:AI-2E family transporter [Rhizobiaceae bacterium]
MKSAQLALVLIATILFVAVMRIAGSVFAPLAFALFIIALAWPVQRRMQEAMPRALALALTFLGVVLVVLGFASLVAWAFGRVGRWLISDAARFQQIYDQIRLWLEAHGIAVAVLWSDNFSATWMLRTVQSLSGRLNTTITFWFVTLVYVLLGLMEVEPFARRAKGLKNRTVAGVLLAGSRLTSEKILRYMLVRTAMSLLTGLLVWLFARAIGLSLAEEWGFIAFVLNYIPFLGPLIATLLPTLFAMTQFDNWESVAGVFICLNLIQSVIGSYVEPRVSGSALSMSPLIVLFSVFFWAYVWGIFGAFIGVPISIAILAFCAQHPSSAWLAQLFGSDKAEAQ